MVGLGILGFVLVGGVIPVGCTMNSIPAKDQKVITAWSQVENQYERRDQLIPQLYGVLEASSNAEIKLVVETIKARAEGLKSTVNIDVRDEQGMKNLAQHQNAMTTALANMKNVVERYPDFKANKQYTAVMSELAGTENRITVARRDYNDAVADLNTTIRTYPGSVANLVIQEKPAMPFVAGGSQGIGRGQAAPRTMGK